MEVELWIEERELEKVALGQPCTIQMEASPKKIYRGRVTRLLPIADRAKGAVGIRVRLEVREGDGPIRPESAAVVRIRAKD